MKYPIDEQLKKKPTSTKKPSDTMFRWVFNSLLFYSKYSVITLYQQK